ncbi:MAG: hypothetical protein M0P30_08085 [Syntrophorhabdaceae bacterium]|nr:hypothetical protein [Syntrophorhabdaceae bacterium]
MIAMNQYEYIRTTHRVYEKSIRQIQKETGHSRTAIRKVLSPSVDAAKPVLSIIALKSGLVFDHFFHDQYRSQQGIP